MARFADYLNPGGVLLMTVAPEAGEVVGHVNGAKVYHASLSPDGYGKRGRIHFDVMTVPGRTRN